MRKYTVLFLLLSVLFVSCTTLSVSSKAFLEHEGQPISLKDAKKSLNINGDFPDTVYLKTQTQTFGFEYEFILVDGRIFFKKRGTDKTEWKLYLETGLPFSKKNKFESVNRVAEIAADADCLYAFSSDGKLYRSYLKEITSYPPFEWVDYFGWPKKIQLYQTDLLKNKIVWTVGSSRLDVEYYTDINGNEHNYGPLGVESIIFLCEDGKTLRYSDPACPSDFSHTFKGPKNGEFEAAYICESASTIFMIGKTGQMYTRLVDYNTVGSDPMLYDYTYDKVESDLKGDNKKSNTTKWALPNQDWKMQPDLPLGSRYTKYITIIQNGKGNDARELRIGAVNSNGETGYYYKNINDSNWTFYPFDFQFNQGDYLERTAYNPSEEKTNYGGYVFIDGKYQDGLCLFVNDFNYSEGPFTLEKVNNYRPLNINEKYERFYISEIWSPYLRYSPGQYFEPARYFATKENDTIHKYYLEVTDNYLLIEFEENKQKVQYYLTKFDATDTLTLPEVNRLYIQYPQFVKNRMQFMKKYYQKEFGDDIEKIVAFENRINKQKRNTAGLLKTGVYSAEVLAHMFFINFMSKKVGIICKYSDDICKYNKSFYSEYFEQSKKYLEYYEQFEKIKKEDPDFNLFNAMCYVAECTKKSKYNIYFINEYVIFQGLVLSELEDKNDPDNFSNNYTGYLPIFIDFSDYNKTSSFNMCEIEGGINALYDFACRGTLKELTINTTTYSYKGEKTVKGSFVIKN